MQVETTFFTGLDQIDLPHIPGRGERFMDEYFLTTDRQKIADLIRPFQHNLGTVEFDWLVQKAPAVIYRKKFIETDRQSLEARLQADLLGDLLALQALIFNFWIIKDNAAFQDRGWMAGRIGQQAMVCNNNWETRLSKSDGSRDSVRFDIEEIRTARSLTRVRGEHLSGAGRPTMLTANSLRYQRFTYFVQAARASGDVAMKLVQYCSGLEALVSTSQSELSHQVAERISCLLEDQGSYRVQTFELVKEAYGYRSKAVHGASFRGKQFDRLRECSTLMDDLCRRCILLYLDSKNEIAKALESKDDVMAKFFVERLLAGHKT